MMETASDSDPNLSSYSSNGKRVLLVGWDAADWKVISPLMEQGRMPNLLRLVERGVKGNIATLHPVLSPMLWTSIATGKRPYKHGIYGFYEPTPDGMSVQPITNLSRKTKAIWNILTQCQLKTNVVGWWPSHPAEPVNGVMVSDLYHKNSIKTGLPKTVPTGAIHPESKIEELAELRFDLGEVDVEDVMNFIPLAKQIDQEKDKRLATCGKVFAECTTIHTAATHLMETTKWDFMAVYYDAIDHFSHSFMRYHPPRRDFIDERDFELFKDVITGAYIYHDMMLGRLIDLAGDDTTIILVSDHGFHPDHMRPAFIPMEPAGPAIEHRDLGVFVMAGPGIAKDQLVHGTTLLDVAPTILAHLGLPIGEDMDGRVIQEVFEERQEVTSIGSWDDLPGQDGSHPAGMELNPLDAKQFLQQLVDLGYIDELSPDKQQNVDASIQELNFNLARAYMDANRFGDGLPLLQDLYAAAPTEHRIGIQLALCYKAMGRIDDLEELVGLLTERRVVSASEARQEMKKWFQTIKERRDKLRENPDYIEPADMKLPQILDEALSEKEQYEFLQTRALASVRVYYLDFLRGYTLCAQGRNEEALLFLQRAIDAEPNRPTLYLQAGEAYLNLKKLSQARHAFEKALAIDDTNPGVHLGLARLCLESKQPQQAIQHALQSVSITYFNPQAHYMIGVGLSRLEKFQQATMALNNAVGQNPNFAEAWEQLAKIYLDQFEDQANADHFNVLAAEAREATRKQSAGRHQTHDSKSEKPVPSVQSSSDETNVESNAKTVDGYLPGLRSIPNRQVLTKAADVPAQESIIVVTGLPRSGTSMMMQMLRSGGVQTLEDKNRPADTDNPKGYVEFQQTRSLLTDNRWVGQALGGGIKVVAPLLEGLPAKFHFKVILMVRDIEEIVTSQTIMLERNEKEGAGVSPERLRGVLKYQFETAARLLNDKGISTLRVPYRTAINQPADVAKAVCEFLGMKLDVDQMAAQVDDSLYRNRSKE